MIFFVLTFLTASQQPVTAQACHCDKYITLKETFVDGKKLSALPGDTICIKAGQRRSLKLFNFRGTSQAPIILINQGGLVEIGDPSWHFGLVIDQSEHFVLTGTGDACYDYGIRINQTKKGATGLALGASDFDVNHIEVANTGFAGIMAKIDPNCNPDSWQENFVMENIRIHHNYIHHTGGEGIYVGYTKSERKLDCNGQSMVIKPHNIENIQIFDNNITHTGWDGIQVSRATKNCEIYNNQVAYYGEKNENWQKAGIVIGGETTGRLYNNLIRTGTGSGIQLFGSGENLVYNNMILYAGEDGIFCKSVQEGHNKSFGYAIVNNTIVVPGGYGLKVNSLPKKANSFCNNWIVQSNKQFIASTDALHASHNYFSTIIPQIVLKTFFLLPAPRCFLNLADKGTDISEFRIFTDYFGKPRSKGNACDIGAQEF